MKTLNEFLTKTTTSENVVVFESHEIDNFANLQEVYEALFDKMFIVEEGLFSKLGNALSKLGKKSEELDSKIEAKKKAMSDAAKAAIESAKKKAGDAWDKVKDTYIAAVAQVDAGMQASKDYIVNLAKATGMKIDELEGKMASMITNAVANGKTKLAEMFADSKKAAAINTLISGAVLCSKQGLSKDEILSVLEIAGIK